jgi:uncharacterized protein
MSRPWYRERWPWALFAGPGSVIVAGIVTMTVAAGSNDGVVADDYYKRGLAINESIERDVRAQQLGLSGVALFSSGKARVVLRSSGAGLPPSVTLRLVHPTRSGEDASAALASIAPGVYEGALPRDTDGRRSLIVEDPVSHWRLKGVLTAGGEAAALTAGAP